MQIFLSEWTEEDWSWPLVAGKVGYVGSATRVRSPDYNPTLAENFPYINVPRDTHSVSGGTWSSPAADFSWLGEIVDEKGQKSYIKPGKYV